jgi:hypothetical protein
MKNFLQADSYYSSTEAVCTAGEREGQVHPVRRNAAETPGQRRFVTKFT